MRDAMRGNGAATVRRVVASLASLAIGAVFAAVLYGVDVRGPWWVLGAIMVGAPVLASGALWTRPLWAQLLARGVWWSFLLFGTFLSLTSGSDRGLGAEWALSGGVALLAAGRLGLDAADRRFRPVAFRGTLVLALVLAMADLLLFLWVGILDAAGGHGGLLLLLPPMAAGVIGLLRLRTWGLLVGMATNLLIISLTATGVLHVPHSSVRVLIMSSAVAQLIVPLPMLVTIATRRAPAPDRWRNARAVGATCVILALAGVSTCGALLHLPRLGH
jgi:hypothetical protein